MAKHLILQVKSWQLKVNQSTQWLANIRTPFSAIQGMFFMFILSAINQLYTEALNTLIYDKLNSLIMETHQRLHQELISFTAQAEL